LDWLWLLLEADYFSALLTLLASIVASGTAIFLGLVTYPRQKRLDREAELIAAQDEAFVQFFGAVERMVNHSSLSVQDEQLDVILRAKSALNELALRVTLEDIEAFTALFGHAMDCSSFMTFLNTDGAGSPQSLIDEVRGPFGDHFNHCINIARRHQLGRDSQNARVGGIFLQLKTEVQSTETQKEKSPEGNDV
jgi:hypothetical protein